MNISYYIYRNEYSTLFLISHWTAWNFNYKIDIVTKYMVLVGYLVFLIYKTVDITR